MTDDPQIEGARFSWAEWLERAGLIDAWWPATEFGADSEAAYYHELCRFPIEDVDAAIRACLVDGSAFAPSLAQILAKMTPAEHDLPTFEKVLNRIQWALRRAGIDGERDGIMMLAGEHAAIADFAISYGWKSLWALELDHEVWGAKVRADLQRRWDDHAARWVERRARGQVRQLVAPRAPRRIEGPRRMDPAALLDAPASAGRVEGSTERG